MVPSTESFTYVAPDGEAMQDLTSGKYDLQDSALTENDDALQFDDPSGFSDATFSTAEEDSDVSSVISVAPSSVFSQGSYPSISSTEEVVEAADEFVALLANDKELLTLYRTSLSRFGAQRFERNVSRLLVRYASDLRTEAQDDLEKAATRLVRARAQYISLCMRERLDSTGDGIGKTANRLASQNFQRQELLERYLSSLHSADKEMVPSNSDPEEDEIDDEQDGPGQVNLPNLDRVKIFMVQSLAFEKMRENLRRFIRSSQEPNREEPAGEGRVMESEGDALSNKEGEYRNRVSPPDPPEARLPPIPTTSVTFKQDDLAVLSMIEAVVQCPFWITESWNIRPPSWTDHAKRTVEGLLGGSVTWWPLAPVWTSCKASNVRLSWNCVSDFRLLTWEILKICSRTDLWSTTLHRLT